MKKLLLIAAVALSCVFTGTPKTSAQSANFTYSNFSGTYTPGSSFSFDITLNFTGGGGTMNVNALSYWLYQISPSSGAYFFSITQYDRTGSLFQGAVPPLPQILDPVNHNGNDPRTDLGGLSQNPQPTGNYFIAHITLSIAGNATPGTYTFGNSTSATPNVGGRISVFSSSTGSTVPIAASNFTIGVVPEPGTFALSVMAAIGLGAAASGRRRSAN